MGEWHTGAVRPCAVTQLGEHYRRYRLPDPEGEADMACSLRRWGQLAPLVVCVRDEQLEVLDGFKRLAAARSLGLSSLSVRQLEADERAAKAALYSLNCTGQRPRDWEEAWIVHALVRDDGLTQLQVAELLGRHKSWVCRRLALLERLAAEAKEDLRLGLLSVSMARQVVRLPTGNQAEVLQVTRRDGLNAAEMRGVVDLLLASASREQEEFVLSKPREALQQAQAATPRMYDPRLSVAGNRLARRLAGLLDELERLEHWLLHGGRAQLQPRERPLFTPSWTRLLRDALVVAELIEDLLAESLHQEAVEAGAVEP